MSCLPKRRRAGIKRLQTALFELRTDRLRPLPSRENRFRHLPVFPLVELDLSVLLDESVSWAELEQLVLGVANGAYLSRSIAANRSRR